MFHLMDLEKVILLFGAFIVFQIDARSFPDHFLYMRWNFYHASFAPRHAQDQPCDQHPSDA